MAPFDENDRFAHLVALRTRIERLVSVLIPSPADVDDVVQQTLVTAWEKIDSFDAEASDSNGFFAWVSTIAVNHARNRQRTVGRDRHVFSSETVSLLAAEATSQAVDWPARERALRTCLDELPEDDRQLIDRCYASGASTADVAATLNRAATSVFRSLRRIRRVLQECVSRKLAEVSP